MEKIGERRAHNAITTTFKVLLQGRNNQPGAGRYESDICGLGWKFGTEWKSGGITKRLEVYFDSHFVSKAEYGALTLSANLASKHGDASSNQRIPLPPGSCDPCAFATFNFFDIAACPVLELTVTFPNNRLPPIPLDNLQLPSNSVPKLKQLVNKSLLGETFDTKFYLFSRRMPSGRVGSPLPLFVNSSLLKGNSPYLDTLLFEGFKESLPVDLSAHVVTPEIDADMYDYDSDSDLESVSEENESSQSENSPRTPDFLQNKVEQSGHHQQTGRMIVMKDTAYTTWKSLLFYLHTEDIVFSSLKSRPPVPVDIVLPETAPQAPPCSPKSMYRLADKIGLSRLKELAFQAIASNLDENNITHELFSQFTSRYPPIRDMEIKKLGQYIDKPIVGKQLERLVQKMAEGSLPHASDVVVLLLGRLRKGNFVEIDVIKPKYDEGPYDEFYD